MKQEQHNRARTKVLMNKLPVPSRLLVPGHFDIEPPVTTSVPLLPLCELSFDNFQRLSVRLLSASSEAISCQEYGTLGQKQEGIDLYARVAGQTKMEVWQCKRYEKITVRDVNAAVKKFLDGKFVAETSKFVLVTSASTEEAKLADAEIAAAKTLREKGIEFQLMGRTKLTEELKKHPSIINDFFGKCWVEACCGRDVAERFTHRLSPSEVTTYRSQLRELYASVFAQADPSYSLTFATGGQNPVPLAQRWVMPMLECGVASSVVPCHEPTERPKNSYDQSPSDEKGEAENVPISMDSRGNMSAEAFISGTNRGIVLGDPGSGKSTLLRMIALDILGDSPSMPSIAQKFGYCLPVWVPFAFLSTQVDKGMPFTEVLGEWVRKHGGDKKLSSLVSSAIEDDRLLLLIDGLDEWSDPVCARTAIMAIQGFLSQHPAASCFVTSRPLGYSRLGGLAGEWETGKLMPFSREQQKNFASLIFTHVYPGTESQLRIKTDQFIRTIYLEGALDEMASTPLLLTGLLALWIRKQSLPDSRVSVYEILVTEMMEEHPQRRASSSAPIPTLGTISSQMRRDALAELAWTIHNSRSSTSISRKDAQDCFQDYFRRAEGMGIPEAKAHARDMLPISQQIIGILYEAAPDEIQFIHRAFQELLAAEHLSTLRFEEQVDFCKRHAGNTAWHEVLLLFIQKSNNRTNTDELVHALAEPRTSLREYKFAQLLLAEVVFSQIRMSPELRANHAKKILDDIESGAWLPFREALLEKALLAPTGTNVHPLLLERLNAWLPEPYDFHVYEALMEWPDDCGAEEALWSLLNHESSWQTIRAAKALATRCKGQKEWRDRLIARLDEPLDCESLGSYILALAHGWFSDAEAIEIFIKGKNTNAPEVALPSILGLVNAGRHDQSCKDALICYANKIYLGETVAEMTLKGWPKDDEIKKMALCSMPDGYDPKRVFSSDSAWQILVEGYPHDDDVARTIAEEILKPYFHLSHRIPRQTIIENFGGHPLLKDACEKIIADAERLDPYKHSLIAALAKTASSKKLLIDWTTTNGGMGFHAADCLIWAWGETDAEVSDALEQVRENPSLIRTYATTLAPKESDKTAARKKLLDSLRDKDNSQLGDWEVIRALSKIRTEESDSEVVETVLRCVESEAGDIRDCFGTCSTTIEGFGDIPKVRAFAERWMNDPECSWGNIAKYYKGDSAIRERIKTMCRCLPDTLRLQIMFRCRQRAAYDAGFRSIAEKFKWENNADARIIGAVTMAETMQTLGEDTSQLADDLAKETIATGPQFDSRSSAGIAGLIALNQANRVLTKRILNDRALRISFGYSPKKTTLFPKYIIKNWPLLKKSFGNKLGEIFKSESELRTLKNVAIETGQTEIANEITAMFKDESEVEGKLSFMAKNKTSGWIDACFKAMALDGHVRVVYGNEPDVASRLLVKYGRDDETIKTRLEECVRKGVGFFDNALKTLAHGWPQSDVLQFVWKSQLAKHSLLERSPVLIATYSAPQEFMLWLPIWLKECAAASSHWFLREIRDFVTRRCFRDPEVASLLLQKLKESNSPDEWVSYPWLLRGNALENVDYALREWIETRWKDTCESNWCVFGFDVFQCKSVPLKVTLLELLLTDKRYTAS